MAFTLDHRLAQVSAPIVDLDLCEARLQLDSRFPWIVLIPRRSNLRELEDLARADLSLLMGELLAAGAAVQAVGAALNRPVDKLNIGALGNMVPQLHIHMVGRRADDAAWPGPVWGSGEAVSYTNAEIAWALEAARGALNQGKA